MSKPNTFPPENLASVLIPKLGSGSVDADFARAITAAQEAVNLTNKRAEVTIKVCLEPNKDVGAMLMRATVTSKMPVLPPPAIQVHVGDRGELLSQLDFIMGGGRSEAPEAAPAKPAAQPVAAAPKPAPVAATPAPAPLAK